VGVALAGVAGAVLLVVADLSTLYSINVPGGITRSFSRHGQHGYALVILGVVAAFMALGALRGAVPAMAALAFLGLVALGITLIGDAGDVHATGTYGQLYENVTAGPGSGFYEETLAAVLLLLAGGAGLVLMGAIPTRVALPRRGGLRWPRRRRRGASAPPESGAEGGPATGARRVDDWFEAAEE